MVTSWNWIYLSDFASYKPTYLPEVSLFFFSLIFFFFFKKKKFKNNYKLIKLNIFLL